MTVDTESTVDTTVDIVDNPVDIVDTADDVPTVNDKPSKISRRRLPSRRRHGQKKTVDIEISEDEETDDACDKLHISKKKKSQ